MASSVQKITLSSSRDIPFSKLVLSQSNVRRVKAGVSIEDLAASIARRGLIQSLWVHPVVDADGKETGMFEVPAGGRRYQALELLVNTKRLAKTAPVPCIVRDRANPILLEEISLAENIERAPLHPLDQFRAFQDMRTRGMSEEEIAAAFFVPVQVVRQRLRLTSVSPALLATYEADGMSLDQLMAFTVSEDHARQEQVWATIKDSWSKEPYQIRRMLTEKTVAASDKRALFVGVAAYEAAGGIVMRDLFQSDDGGWLQDVALLESLVNGKLKADAEIIATEGWKWVEAAIDFPYGHAQGLKTINGVFADLTGEERATREALRNEHDELEVEYQDADELPEQIDARLGEIETALATFENRSRIYDRADIARAGAFVTIDQAGRLVADRGYVRPEDDAPVAGGDEQARVPSGGEGQDGNAATGLPNQRAVITIGGQPAEPGEDDDTIQPLPDRLVVELTAGRTLALRNKFANTPEVAFHAVLHKFCLDAFPHFSPHGAAIEVSIRSCGFPVQAPGLKDMPSAREIAERHKAWEARLPKDRSGLWDWLATLGGAEQVALFAHCASFAVNALYEKADRGGGCAAAPGVAQRLADADCLARAVGLDMMEAGWRPTVDNYLGRVTKHRILEAVREGAGEQASQLIEHLKKGDMAKEAERLLADTGWLPEPLRPAGGDLAAIAPNAQAPETDAVPAFLAGAKPETGSAEAAEPRTVAAE